jgi:serine/threonine protein kinase
MAEFTLLGGRYQKEKDLGKGSFGKVFRAIDRIAG